MKVKSGSMCYVEARIIEEWLEKTEMLHYYDFYTAIWREEPQAVKSAYDNLIHRLYYARVVIE